VTIKDNIATKGVPVPLGAATATLVPSAVDAHRRRACAKQVR